MIIIIVFVAVFKNWYFAWFAFCLLILKSSDTVNETDSKFKRQFGATSVSVAR